MKTLGLIGGLSWYSTMIYYRRINEISNERLGGSHSAKLLLYSLDFEPFKLLQEREDWHAIEGVVVEVANTLETAGAEGIMICANTPHIIAHGVRGKIGVPLISIVEATAKAIEDDGMRKVALLGTKYTMEGTFFQEGLAKNRIETIVPEEDEREFINSAIYQELTKGSFTEETRSGYIKIIERLASEGSEGVIFGCTEIGLLVPQDRSPLPVFDTAEIHAQAAVAFALS